MHMEQEKIFASSFWCLTFEMSLIHLFITSSLYLLPTYTYQYIKSLCHHCRVIQVMIYFHKRIKIGITIVLRSTGRMKIFAQQLTSGQAATASRNGNCAGVHLSRPQRSQPELASDNCRLLSALPGTAGLPGGVRVRRVAGDSDRYRSPRHPAPLSRQADC